MLAQTCVYKFQFPIIEYYTKNCAVEINTNSRVSGLDYQNLRPIVSDFTLIFQENQKNQFELR
jgi:hypothetical protein